MSLTIEDDVTRDDSDTVSGSAVLDILAENVSTELVDSSTSGNRRGVRPGRRRSPTGHTVIFIEWGLGESAAANPPAATLSVPLGFNSNEIYRGQGFVRIVPYGTPPRVFGTREERVMPPI